MEYETSGLTRKFHTGSSRGAANPYADTTGSRETAVVSALALTRIFHTDCDEETAKADGVRQTSILMPGCMCTYCPNQNVSLTQYPSGFPASAGD
jgi:hypothetical protein